MTTLTFLTLLCLTTVVARADISLDPCAGDPANWCQSLSTAIECQAIAHCVTTVWAPQTTTSQAPNQNFLCGLCKTAANVFLPVIQNRRFQNLVLRTLRRLCRLIPNRRITRRCFSYTARFLPRIFRLINNLSSTDVCQILNLCPRIRPSDQQEISLLISNEIPSQPLAQAHTMCLDFMKELEDFLDNDDSKGSFVEAVRELCSQLPEALTAECEEIVEEYGQAGLEMFVRLVTPEAMCSILEHSASLDNSNGEEIEDFLNDLLDQ